MEDEKKHQNLPDVPERVLTFNFLKKYIKEMANKKKYLALDKIDWVSDGDLEKKINLLGNKDYICWIGHAGYLVSIANVNLLIDPFISNRASPFKNIGPKRYVKSPLTIKTLPKINLILITHNHYDHLDKHFLKSLPEKDSIVMIVPKDLGRTFKGLGFTQIVELGWYESHNIENIRVTAVPAYHYSQRGLFDKNKSLWCSYCIISETVKLYHSGDTAYGKAFKDIGLKYGPFDYAMVGIGGYCPSEMMKYVHSTPEEAFKIAEDIKAKCILPMHWGTIALSSEVINEPIVRLRKMVQSNNFSIEIKLDKIGDILLL